MEVGEMMVGFVLGHFAYMYYVTKRTTTRWGCVGVVEIMGAVFTRPVIR